MGGSPKRSEQRVPQFITRPGCRLILAVVALLMPTVQACNRQQPAGPIDTADRIVIEKSSRTMTLMNGARAVRVYKVALGRNPVGAKTIAGDHKTPEGDYIIDGKKNNSKFHQALHLSYPNQSDRERAARAGARPGGDVEIHGIENGLGWIGGWHRRIDWTDGCIAVTDTEIEEIWKMVPVGAPVEIKP